MTVGLAAAAATPTVRLAACAGASSAATSSTLPVIRPQSRIRHASLSDPTTRRVPRDRNPAHPANRRAPPRLRRRFSARSGAHTHLSGAGDLRVYVVRVPLSEPSTRQSRLGVNIGYVPLDGAHAQH